MKESLGNVSQSLVDGYHEMFNRSSDNPRQFPSSEVVIDCVGKLFKLIFPCSDTPEGNAKKAVCSQLESLFDIMAQEVVTAFAMQQPLQEAKGLADQALSHLSSYLSQIQQLAGGDVLAAYDRDPASKTLEEIIIAYPGIRAITGHRIAHELYLQGVPLIPRIICEHIHSTTGIDIHPGAVIGRNLFIDHGTGVVVGETTVIGDNVTLYQGVTLGALAPRKGQSLRDVKRHPTIENNVTIYAEATLLGDITIGAGSVIGGNVWLKESVPSDSRIMVQERGLIRKRAPTGSDLEL